MHMGYGAFQSLQCFRMEKVKENRLIESIWVCLEVNIIDLGGVLNPPLSSLLVVSEPVRSYESTHSFIIVSRRLTSQVERLSSGHTAARALFSQV